MGNFLQDIQYAFRTVTRNGGFAALVVFTLALGIGANTVIFSLVNSLVLNPFSFPEPQTLVGVGPAFPKLNQDLSYFEVLSPHEYLDIKGSETLTDVVAWDMGNRQVSGEDRPENLFSGFWWGDAFQTLRVRPHLGRGFSEKETTEGAAVCIVSHRVWRSLLGEDPEAVGKTLHVNGDPFLIVGVMPEGSLVFGTDLWLPMGVSPERFPRGRRQFQVLGRMVDGATMADVNAELKTIAGRIEAEFGSEFTEYEGWSLVGDTWTRVNTSLLRPAAVVLMGAVGFVLLLICANLASLYLARSVKRQQEIAVRTALGANRSRIMAQLLTESSLVAVVGGLAGLALTFLSIPPLNRFVESLGLFVLQGRVRMDLDVLLFTAVISLAAGVVFGLVPAIQASRADVQTTLKNETRGATQTGRKQRLQSFFVAVEVALAVVLLVGSGLLINSFIRLSNVESGFQPGGILTMRLTLPWEQYQDQKIPSFFTTLIERLEALPDVESASAGTAYPPRVFGQTRFRVRGQEVDREGRLPVSYFTQVTEGYFDTLKIPLVKGRHLSSADRDGTPPVVVVNQAWARRFLQDREPIGERVKLVFPNDEGPELEIVGVVGSTLNLGPQNSPQPEMFVNVRQAQGSNNQLFLLVRSRTDERAVLPQIRREVAALDADQPIYSIQTIDESFVQATTRERIASTALSGFAVFSLVLAAVGIFSVVSYKVAARTREIGLRIAMGAQAVQVRRHVTRQALVPIALGALVGLATSLGLSSAMRGLLFQVSPSDPVTIGAVLIILITVGFLSSYLPAYRASRMDPVTALRHE